MKSVQNNNWKIKYGTYEGDNHLTIYNLQGEHPVSLSFIIGGIGGDISISYFDMGDDPYDFNEDKQFIIDKSCPILPALLQLTEEKTHDFITDAELSHIQSPVINDDFSSDTMQVSKIPEGVAFDFNFEQYSDQNIDIKNVGYDGRSDIDRRHSDYKERLVSAVRDSFKILNKLNPVEEFPFNF